MAKKWYVIQTYSGFENRVRESLQQRIKEFGKEALFGEILIPTETVQEARASGKTRVRQKNSFPGYIFVEMEMGEEAGSPGLAQKRRIAAELKSTPLHADSPLAGSTLQQLRALRGQ